MSDKIIKVPQQAWYDDSELSLEFPATWDVRVHHMKGWDRPAIGVDAIRRSFANPLGVKPIRELARGKKEVVIIFDDIARPTKVSQLVPYVLEELAAGGISDEHIRFVCALGNHGAHTRAELVAKLGDGIPGRFPVYNHNPFELCTFVGTTTSGTPVKVNAEVMSCDLKIGIGSILPHPLTGWGGGSKILLPGVCSIETVAKNHSRRYEITPIMGKYDGNPIRIDIEEAARLAGLDIVVDALINEKRDTVDLLVGNAVEVVREGARRGQEIYATEAADASYDVIVANTYAKGNEALLATRRAPTWGNKAIDYVLIANNPGGQVTHYLSGPFGNGSGGRQFANPAGLAAGVRRLLVYSEYPDKAVGQYWGNPKMVEWYGSWGRIVEELQSSYPGGAKVAVFPDLTIQYFPILAS